MVLVADEKHLPPVAVSVPLDFGNPVQYGPLTPVIPNKLKNPLVILNVVKNPLVILNAVKNLLVILNAVKNLRSSPRVPETKSTAVILRSAQDDNGMDFEQRGGAQSPCSSDSAALPGLRSQSPFRGINKK